MINQTFRSAMSVVHAILSPTSVATVSKVGHDSDTSPSAQAAALPARPRVSSPPAGRRAAARGWSHAWGRRALTTRSVRRAAD